MQERTLKLVPAWRPNAVDGRGETAGNSGSRPALYPSANGEGGIRTHGTRKGSPVFETGSFNHSDTSPGPCIIEQDCFTFHPSRIDIERE